MTRQRGRWLAGVLLSGLVVAFLLLDAVGHVLGPAPVVEASAAIGWRADQMVVVGVVALACLVVHVVPRTAVVGAFLLTAYLGGAVASNLRADMPLLTHVLFPVWVAAALWGGLWLRDGRVGEVVRAALARPRAPQRSASASASSSRSTSPSSV
ncbi:DoxX family protein [Aquipuribacter sp. SD81]|uniref:DoxX family protein n=1 Tax=Aquipuribacter sp. SD81 TaxID=3127703 RepID=UPI00301ABCFB